MLHGNNKSCMIAKIISIRLMFHDESVKLLSGVRYVPKLKRNLIYLGELNKKGYMFKGEQGVFKVLKESMVEIQGVKKNGLYSFKAKTVNSSIATASLSLYQSLKYGP